LLAGGAADGGTPTLPTGAIPPLLASVRLPGSSDGCKEQAMSALALLAQAPGMHAQLLGWGLLPAVVRRLRLHWPVPLPQMAPQPLQACCSDCLSLLPGWRHAHRPVVPPGQAYIKPGSACRCRCTPLRSRC
jgi:hypothetical protein